MFTQLLTNTVETFNQIIGRDYYRYRVVFYENDLEIAFVSDSLIGNTRVHINGDEVARRWPPLMDFYGNVRFSRDGIDYRIRNYTTNLLSCAQRITLYVDDVQVQEKEDGRFANLNYKQILHVTGGLVVLGLAIGFALKALGI